MHSEDNATKEFSKFELQLKNITLEEYKDSLLVHVQNYADVIYESDPTSSCDIMILLYKIYNHMYDPELRLHAWGKLDKHFTDTADQPFLSYIFRDHMRAIRDACHLIVFNECKSGIALSRLQKVSLELGLYEKTIDRHNPEK